MRLNVDMTGLTDQNWIDLQDILRAQYEIPDGATRVCLVATHGELERHVEMPVGSLVSVLLSLMLRPGIRLIQTAMAALTPDDKDLDK